MNLSLPFKHTVLPTKSGFSIPIRYLSPSEAGLHPFVVMLSGDGLGGSKSLTYDKIAARLYNHQIGSVIFDFVGLGKSEHKPSELTFQIAVQNFLDVLEFTRKLEFSNSSAVGIFGSSFGGFISLATVEPASSVKAIALKSPVSFYPESHDSEFSQKELNKWEKSGMNKENGFSYDFYLSGFDFNPYNTAKKISTPVLICHGDNDSVVPIQQSYRLKRCLSLKGNPLMKVYKGVDHGYEEGDSREEMMNDISTFLIKSLK